MVKAQISMELIILLGFVLVLTGPLIVIYYNYSSKTEFELSQNQAHNIVNKIVDHAESVYYQGEPSKIIIKIAMPDHIENVIVNNRDITFQMKRSGNLFDVVASSKVNLTGNLEVTSGIKYISIESLGDSVNITNT